MNPKLPDTCPASLPTFVTDSPSVSSQETPLQFLRSLLSEVSSAFPSRESLLTLLGRPHGRATCVGAQGAHSVCSSGLPSRRSNCGTQGFAGDLDAPDRLVLPSSFHGTLTYAGTPTSL